ncbi:hypothetical protein CAL12_14200 [Bordetella genomosp. 8]|uniref:Peptidase n=1 Tax=Bordetella genomosp. 8 TaxID=1416806 RepID=A0A1W6YMU0_9BORD|nr:PepSY-associated TM helix domain-containing protein [Bordetella genomosp. 8]ARP81853.1 hypothetical protein CAL12_14200 [Bordetella genomosp. 8]
MRSLRRVWLLCHRWTALCLGWLLVLSGITGSLLVVARPMDRWLHPAYFQAVSAGSPGAGMVAFEGLRQRLAAEFGTGASFTFAPPRRAGETLQVLVRGSWRGSLYLDPDTGVEQGRRGADEGLVAWLYGLHSALWMDQTGKAVLACAALAYLLLALTGVVLWWPRRWPPSLRIEFGKGGTRALFDVHRTGGVVAGLLLAVCMGTGAYLAWRPIGGWITWLSGAPRTVAPVLPQVQQATLPQVQQPTQPSVSLDDLANRARAAFPDGAIGYFLYTPRTDRPLAIRMRVPDDPHPNGRSTVWLDPRTGAILATQRWNELDPGTRINSYIYPLHTGELGGIAGQGTVALLGLLLAALGGSGIWLWWRRRRARRQL